MGKTAWKDEFLVRVYKLARSGLRDKPLARCLGVGGKTFASWVASKPALADALEQGRDDGGRQRLGGSSYQGFKRFAYDNLPPDARKLWNQLDRVYRLAPGRTREARRAAMRAVLESQGKRMRQSLFLQALVASNFVMSIACRTVDLTPHAVRQWARKDRAFAELVAGIHQSKAAFFESALLGLVARHDSAATIWANKTYNRARGYGSQDQEAGESTSSGRRYGMDELDLPPEVLRIVLDKARERSRRLSLANPM